MTEHKNSRNCFHLISAFVFVFSCFSINVLGQANITVGKNVMVSMLKPRLEHTEYVADAHQDDPDRLIVCSMRFSQTENQISSAAYVSFDGGKSWKLGYEDKSSRFEGVWDPACAFGLNNQVFFITLALNETKPSDLDYRKYEFWRMGGDRVTHVYRSNDAGRIWEPLAEFSKLDRGDLKIDRTGSPYRGRMYLYGNTPGTTIWLIYSSDGGRTWVRSSETKADGSAKEEGPGTILPNGTLLLPYRFNPRTENLSRSIAVAASMDGGEHIGLPVSVAPFQGGCGGLAGMTSDHSAGPFHGRAYLMWGSQYRGACSILVSNSDDNGKTWTDPVRIKVSNSIRYTAYERLMPQIAINKNGIVGVSWYEFREFSKSREYRLRFTASLDGGGTWLPSVPVSTQSFVVKHPPQFAANAVVSGGGRRATPKKTESVDVRVLPSPRSYYSWNNWPGDYTGMCASADGAFHVFWIDNRSGASELYTARVSVKGNVTSEFTHLQNVTSALELQYTASEWNRRQKTLSLEYQFLNTSEDTILVPFKIKILTLESDLGTPELAFTRNQTVRPGTILNLSHLIPKGGLAPGATTRPQRLRVKFNKINDLFGESEKAVLEMQIKVFGTRSIKATGSQ